MRTLDLIHRKRDGEELSAEEISFLIDGYTRNEIPDYQISAFLMAVFFSGMTDREVSALTDTMIASGEHVDLSDIPGVKVDKHSTGGVGDKTSLIAAPIAAAAGVVVPMISGRGLGHTGGTLDKLESIPGFRTSLTIEEFKAQLAKLNLAFIGQTPQITPADGKLYSLRDATATVESIRENDPDLAQKIMDQMFTFDNVLDLDDKGIQLVMREVQSESLVVALKGADIALREKIFKNMSQRAAETLRDDLESKGPVRLSEVEAEQKEILKIVRRLAEEGQIMLGGKGEESYV